MFICLIDSAVSISNLLTYADLSNVQAVGITLYLALAIIQGVSSGGVAVIRRRVASIEAAAQALLSDEDTYEIMSLRAEICRVEISFQSINRTILFAVLALTLIGVIWFAYATIYFGIVVCGLVVFFIMVYYLFVPFILFIAIAALIHFKCRDITKKIALAEKQVRRDLIGRR